MRQNFINFLNRSMENNDPVYLFFSDFTASKNQKSSLKPSFLVLTAALIIEKITNGVID